MPVVVGEQVDAVLALFGLSIDPPDERLLDVLQSIGMQIGDFIEVFALQEKART